MTVDAQYWVLLADPEQYGWSDLLRDGHAVWDGISNARAQQNLRRCKIGDVALLYHTAPDKAVMATVRISRAAYPDPNAPERVVIEIEPIGALTRPLPIAELRADAKLAEMGFVKMPRVAVQPVTSAQWERVMQVSGTDLDTSIGTSGRDAGGP